MSSGILYPLRSAFCRVDIRLVAAALAGARVATRAGRLMRQYLVINDVLRGAEARQDGLAMAILEREQAALKGTGSDIVSDTLALTK